MKILVLLSAWTAACLASPAPSFLSGVATPLDAASYAPAVFAAPALSSQFHAQDQQGQYSYGYLAGPSAKAESRGVDGSVSGGYSYVDANGLLQTTRYVSDPVNGFRVAATNLPEATARPVLDTPEVARARAAHAAFVADVAARSAASTATLAAAPEARDSQQEAAPASAATGRSAATATSYANIVLGPSGVPLDTPEVAAARAADAVAHLQAKVAALLG